MSRRKEMWVDCDEVLGDFVTVLRGAISEVCGLEICLETHGDWDLCRSLTVGQDRAVWEYIEKTRGCAKVRPLPGAEDAIRELRKMVDLFVVTAAPRILHWHTDRIQWLYGHFGFQHKDVVFCSKKYRVVADAILDDRPSTVLDWKARHPCGLAMMWYLPNTSHITDADPYRVRSWDEVLKMVENMVREG